MDPVAAQSVGVPQTAATQPPQVANTIDARLKVRQNNFDFIRVAASFAVILSHAYPLRDGTNDLEPFHLLSGYSGAGEVAVAIFFIISGMLVARSFISDPSPVAYLRKRSLRIFPGLIVCIALCILVFGPIFTTLPFRQYILHRQTLKFVRNIFLYPNQYRLPGVFEQFDPIYDPRSAVNGSLWSLTYEFAMYLAVLALGVMHLLTRRRVILSLTAACGVMWVVVAHFFGEGGSMEGKLGNFYVWFEETPMLAFLFFAGTLMLLYRERIQLDWRWFALCLLATVLSWQTTHDFLVTHIPLLSVWKWRFWQGKLLFWLVMPYMVMYLAFVRIPVLQSVTKWGDFSYGVYLYGFPVEQILMRTWGDKIPFVLFIGLSCVGSLLLAMLSWHLVEKPFLKGKGKHKPSKPPVTVAPMAVGSRDAAVAASVVDPDRPQDTPSLNRLDALVQRG